MAEVGVVGRGDSLDGRGGRRRRRSGPLSGATMVVAEKSAETFSAMYRSRRIGNLPNRPDTLVPEPLVRSFLVIVGHVLAHGTAQLLFVHGDQMVHALGLDGEHEPLRVGVQVRTPGRKSQARIPITLKYLNLLAS